MKTKIRSKTGLFFCLLAALFVFRFAAYSDEKIKIGVSLPLTGSGAGWGSDIRNALEFAKDTLGETGLEFDFQDDACDPKTALTAANWFTSIAKIQYVLGFGCSGTLLATADLYSQKKIVQITSSASAEKITALGPYTYRTFPSDRIAAQKLFEHISKRHKRIGILTQTSDYTDGFVSSLESANSEGKVTFINEAVISDLSDYRSNLLKLRSQKIDAIIINSQMENGFLGMLRQIHQQQLDLPIYGIYFPSSKTLIKEAGALLEGVQFVDLPSPEDVLTTEGKKIYAQFVERYGEPNTVPLLVVTTYESFRAISAAIKSKQPVLNYLDQTTFEGLTGQWSFDKNGEIQGLAPVMKVIRAGAPTAIF
jgi:branched-chain amino acid transport system substrate-binding protein